MDAACSTTGCQAFASEQNLVWALKPDELEPSHFALTREACQALKIKSTQLISGSCGNVLSFLHCSASLFCSMFASRSRKGNEREPGRIHFDEREDYF